MRDPDLPLHPDEFSITKNRPDLKLKNDLQEKLQYNISTSLSPGPK
jgi:hypothetical protein